MNDAGERKLAVELVVAGIPPWQVLECCDLTPAELGVAMGRYGLVVDGAHNGGPRAACSGCGRYTQGSLSLSRQRLSSKSGRARRLDPLWTLPCCYECWRDAVAPLHLDEIADPAEHVPSAIDRLRVAAARTPTDHGLRAA